MTPAPPGQADAFVVSCIDPRLTDDTTFLMAALGRTDRYSEMRIAGAALAAVDPARPAWGTALWENLAASRQLHGVRTVVFVNHRDCGALHLWAGRRLADDPAEELRQHHGVLEGAAAAVRARHPDMAVEIRLMELDGTATLLPCAACAAAGPATGLLRAEAVPDPAAARFADLARLRIGDGALDAAAERALLVEGVTRHGLTAEAARAALSSAAAQRGRATVVAAEREALAFLRSRAGRGVQVDQADVVQAAGLYRALVGASLPLAEAKRHIAGLIEREGLAPRPEGLLRSTAWFRRLTTPLTPGPPPA
ncbi:hypothetical protein [Falsiroseomonas sp. E2-1-a20]|uniref:hypothetical protein n=1 Tax=Falsiroseomonas sp. E2-1-a20 TaxID=3239300 RepID=UPI003F2D3BCF